MVGTLNAGAFYPSFSFYLLHKDLIWQRGVARP